MGVAIGWPGVASPKSRRVLQHGELVETWVVSRSIFFFFFLHNIEHFCIFVQSQIGRAI